MPGRKYPWEQMRIAYLSGHTPKQIGEKYGVKASLVSNYAFRNNWVREAEETAESVARQCIERALKPSERFTKLVSDITFKSLETLKLRELPEDPYAANAVAGTVQKFNDVGRKNFGLDVQSPSTVINIKLLSEAPVQDAIEVQSLSNQALDGHLQTDTPQIAEQISDKPLP